MDEMLEKNSTKNSSVAGAVAASVGEVRQDEESDDDEAVPRQTLPSLPALFERFNELEKISVKGGVFDALRHIRMLRSLLLAAKMEETRKSSMQLLITELFEKQ